MSNGSVTLGLDQELVDAIREAAREHGQSDVFAKRMVAWINGLSVGSANLDSNTAVREYFNGLSSVVELGVNDDEG